MKDPATSLSQKPLIFVSGKGGTGKTLASCLLACRMAELGKRVLLVESVLREQIPPLFNRKGIAHQETPLIDGIDTINLDNAACLKEYVVDYLGMETLYHSVFERPLMKNFLEAIPGLGEAMLLGRLVHSCETGSYDCIIYDSPASWHFLTLMTTLEAILNSALVGPLVSEVKKIYDFLVKPENTGIVLTTLLRELVIGETFEFWDELAKHSPVLVNCLWVNRMVSKLPSPDANKLSPALARYCSGWSQRESSNYQTLQRRLERFDDVSVIMTKELGRVPRPLTVELFHQGGWSE